MKRFFAAILPFLMLSATTAQAFDHSDLASLDAALQRFAADLEAERYVDVDAAIPPGVYAMFVAQSGGTKRVMRAKVIELELRLMGETDILNVTFDANNLRSETSVDGHDYAFLPTRTTTSNASGPAVTTSTQTFALQEDGVWFFLRLKRPSDFKIIQAAYPSFVDINPPN